MMSQKKNKNIDAGADLVLEPSIRTSRFTFARQESFHQLIKRLIAKSFMHFPGNMTMDFELNKN